MAVAAAVLLAVMFGHFYPSRHERLQPVEKLLTAGQNENMPPASSSPSRQSDDEMFKLMARQRPLRQVPIREFFGVLDEETQNVYFIEMDKTDNIVPVRKHY